MSVITILNNGFCKIDQLDYNIISQIDSLLSYQVPGAQFTKVYKIGRWDGFKHLLKPDLSFPYGLLSKVCNCLKQNNVQYSINDTRTKQLTKSLDITKELKKINKTPYDYQIEAASVVKKHDCGIIRAATGAGKCSSFDSLHITSEGILNYIELLGDTKLNDGELIDYSATVATPLSSSKTDVSSKIYCDGYSDSFKLKTSYGYEITATPEHKIKVINNDGNFVWKKMEDITTDDYAVICHGTNLFGKESISLDDAYWYGLLIGDGGLSRKNLVGFTNQDQHITDFVKKYLKNKNLKSSIYVYDNNLHQFNINNTTYRSHLNKLGFKQCLSINKEIPIFLRKISKKCLAMVIRGIYETDGWVEDKPAICIGLSSKKLVDQLQLILLNFGIISSRRLKKTTHADSHILSIYKDFIPKFIKEIGFDPNGRKFLRLNKAISKITINNTNTYIVPNQQHRIKTILDGIAYIHNNKSFFFKNAGLNYQVIRSWSGKCFWRNPSKINLIKFIQKCKPEFLNLKNNNHLIKNARHALMELEEICNENYFFDKIKSKEKTKSLNFDFVIPKTHSFVSQGFINHNTLIMTLMTANLNKSTIIYVIGIDLLYQIHKLFSSIFGAENIGMVGDGNCDIKEGKINIVSVWTAGLAFGLGKSAVDSDSEKTIDIEKYDKIKELIARSQVHIFDECHVLKCNTIQTIIDNSNPENIYGMSASPYHENGEDLLIEASLGDKIVDISASELIERGYLVEPRIKFNYVPPARFPKGTSYKTIYNEYIVNNKVRNDLIIQNANQLVDLGHKVLVLYNTINHGKILFEEINKQIPSCLLSGKDSSQVRDEAKRKIESGEIKCIVASTIFDIGVDIPCLSGLVLGGGGKSFIRGLQRIGRVIRKTPDTPNKTYAAIYDFKDNAKYLSDHSKARKNIYLAEKGFKIKWPEQK